MLSVHGHWWRSWGLGGISNSSVVNAAGESAATIGRVRFGTASAGSRTLSAAGGGQILFFGQGTTWANAGTNLRVGLQGVDLATGLEDGSYDVQVNLVPGTENITAGGLHKFALESGSVSLAEGDLIAAIAEMTARGGSDAVSINRGPISTIVGAGGLTNSEFPYGTVDTGAGPVRVASNSTHTFAFIFDDGTYGWIDGAIPCHFGGGATSVAVNSGSTPDEYCGTFTVPLPIEIVTMLIPVDDLVAGATFEAILYRDPYGTPVALQTIAIDPDAAFQGTSLGTLLVTIPRTTLLPGQTYGVAVRPTAGTNVSYSYYAGNANTTLFKPFQQLGDISVATRTNQSGAFSVLATDHVPVIMLGLTGIYAPPGIGRGIGRGM
jgi:hypothetical protein